MSTKRILGIICFVLAIGLVIAGINTVSRGPDVSDPSGLGVSHAVGAFLPALVTVIVGLWLFKKPEEDQ